MIAVNIAVKQIFIKKVKGSRNITVATPSISKSFYISRKSAYIMC